MFNEIASHNGLTILVAEIGNDRRVEVREGEVTVLRLNYAKAIVSEAAAVERAKEVLDRASTNAANWR